jgi:phospholipase C
MPSITMRLPFCAVRGRRRILCWRWGTQGFGEQVRLRTISPHIAGGEEVATSYDHPSLLRTIENAFGISSHLNNAGAPTEHAMTDLFVR